jgi:hypothetical protein
MSRESCLSFQQILIIFQPRFRIFYSRSLLKWRTIMIVSLVRGLIGLCDVCDVIYLSLAHFEMSVKCVSTLSRLLSMYVFESSSSATCRIQFSFLTSSSLSAAFQYIISLSLLPSLYRFKVRKGLNDVSEWKRERK